MISTLKRFSFLLLTISLSILPVFSQSNKSSTLDIQKSVAIGDWTNAQTLVQKLKNEDPELYRSAEFEYLSARIFEKLSRDADAIRAYNSVATETYQLADYAHWHLAQIARRSGDLVLERQHLRKLALSSIERQLIDAARLRLTESFFESRDFVGASGAAKTLQTSKNAALSREGSYLLGRAYMLTTKYPEARDVFNRLLMQMPDASRPDDFALGAVRELDELQKRTDPAPVPLTEADHLLRASVYHFNRDFVGARSHYQSVVDANSQPGIVANALYQLGRGYYSETKFEEAIKFFQRVVDQFPESSNARDALSFLAASNLRLKRIDDSVAAYKLFISKFPEGTGSDRAYLNLIDALHEGGRHQEALNWVQQTRARYKTDITGNLALFAQLRIHLAQGAWADVIRDSDELSKAGDLGGARVPGGTFPAEVAFLKAFALEQLGRNEEAINSYLAITDGRNEYYGERATQRLQALSLNQKTSSTIRNRFSGLASAARSAVSSGRFDEARTAAQNAIRLTTDQKERTELINILRRCYVSLPSYKLQSFTLIPLTTLTSSVGDKLFAFGLYDEAMPELLAAKTAATKSAATTTSSFNDEGYSIAVYSLLGGLPNRTVRFGEQLWKPLPADYVLEAAPRKLVELLYPAPFTDSLLKHAPSRNVDPRFVLAIVRQESRYQVDVKSVAAARGMMQFIPSTANEIAAQLKLDGFVQDDLYDADTAILFGSQYLANLFQQFPNQPQAVAGSYNGGADNLTRWIGRSKSSEADRYVPEIGFSQTKDYVYKVMTNYWNYERLYDNQLKPITK